MRSSRPRSRSRPNRGQEPEVEGTSGADADIIKNTEDQGEDTEEDKIQPNLEPQAQSEYQSGSQSQVEADDEDNRDEQALVLLFADTLLKYTPLPKIWKRFSKWRPKIFHTVTLARENMKYSCQKCQIRSFLQ